MLRANRSRTGVPNSSQDAAEVPVPVSPQAALDAFIDGNDTAVFLDQVTKLKHKGRVPNILLRVEMVLEAMQKPQADASSLGIDLLRELIEALPEDQRGEAVGVCLPVLENLIKVAKAPDAYYLTADVLWRLLQYLPDGAQKTAGIGAHLLLVSQQLQKPHIDIYGICGKVLWPMIDALPEAEKIQAIEIYLPIVVRQFSKKDVEVGLMAGSVVRPMLEALPEARRKVILNVVIPRLAGKYRAMPNDSDTSALGAVMLKNLRLLTADERAELGVLPHEFEALTAGERWAKEPHAAALPAPEKSLGALVADLSSSVPKIRNQARKAIWAHLAQLPDDKYHQAMQGLLPQIIDIIEKPGSDYVNVSLDVLRPLLRALVDQDPEILKAQLKEAGARFEQSDRFYIRMLCVVWPLIQALPKDDKYVAIEGWLPRVVDRLAVAEAREIDAIAENIFWPMLRGCSSAEKESLLAANRERLEEIHGQLTGDRKLRFDNRVLKLMKPAVKPAIARRAAGATAPLLAFGAAFLLGLAPQPVKAQPVQARALQAHDIHPNNGSPARPRFWAFSSHQGAPRVLVRGPLGYTSFQTARH